ncbi:MAG: hypothetical protein AB4062_06720 [Crocosphaera sp.]
MTKIQIHEFSTGISVQGTPENWWLNRFTGYMNLTLSQVPPAVQNAISNGLFKAAEGSVEQGGEPAIIGREVKEKNDAWSVIAVITVAKDEKGRNVPVYRYFLTQNIGNLAHLLYWYIIEAKKPVFDPFDEKKIGEFYEYDTNKLTGGNPLAKQEFQDLLNSKDDIIIVPHNLKCVPIIVNELASRKKGDNQLTAWAYKVEGLTKPLYFQAIYPASQKAQETIEKKIKKGENLAPIVEREYPIKKAIKTLSNQSGVKYDFLNEIEKALNLSLAYTDDTWEKSIFQPLDIKGAKSGSFDTHLFIRLYELYGLILPQEFPNFLKWLKLDEIKQEKDFEQQHYQIASELSRNIQKEINQSPNYFKTIEYKAFQGIDYIISHLILEQGLKGIEFEQETRKNLLQNWLKLDTDGLWQTVYKQYYHQLWEDIEQISNNYITARNSLIQAYRQISSKNLLSSETEIKRLLKTTIQQSKLKPQKKSNQQETYYSKYAYENLQILGQDNWKAITTDIIELIWFGKYSKHDQPNKKYLQLAQFFQQMGENDENSRNNFLSAIFYHLASGEVPTSIWKKCHFYGQYTYKLKLNNIPEAPRIKLTRELEWWEPILALIIQTSNLVDKFWTEPYRNSDDEGSQEALLWRYLILIIISVLIVDVFNFSPTQTVQSAVKSSSKVFVYAVMNIEKQLTRLSKEENQIYSTVTIPALNSIVIDINEHGKLRNSRKPLIQKAITNIITPPDSDIKLDFNTKDQPAERVKWVNTIKEYQKRVNQTNPPIKLLENGVIKTKDATDERLKCEVTHQLQLKVYEYKINYCKEYGVDLTVSLPTPSPTPTRELSYWEETVKALDAMRNEFIAKGKAKSITKKQVETAITNNIAKGYPYQFMKDNEEQWVNKIKRFQEENLIDESGYMKQDDGTYNLLQCKVVDELALNDQYPSCRNQPQ